MCVIMMAPGMNGAGDLRLNSNPHRSRVNTIIISIYFADFLSSKD